MTSTSTTDGGWKFSSAKEAEAYYSAPVYKYASATVPITKEVMDDYKSKITEEIFKESHLMRMLREQTENAKDAMATNLERELFGSKTMKRNEGLRQLIADAYDEHMPKEAEVSTEDIVRKAVDKKKEERAENLVEYMTDFFDNGEFEDGDTIGWTCRFRNNEKVYRYSAIKSGGMWYITNRNGSFDDMEMVKIITTLAIDGTVVLSGDEEPL